MIPCSVQGILWFEGHVKVTAIRLSPTSLSDRCKFERRLRDYGMFKFRIAVFSEF